jgi:hypothetical protein
MSGPIEFSPSVLARLMRGADGKALRPDFSAEGGIVRFTLFLWPPDATDPLDPDRTLSFDAEIQDVFALVAGPYFDVSVKDLPTAAKENKVTYNVIPLPEYEDRLYILTDTFNFDGTLYHFFIPSRRLAENAKFRKSLADLREKTKALIEREPVNVAVPTTRESTVAATARAVVKHVKELGMPGAKRLFDLQLRRDSKLLTPAMGGIELAMFYFALDYTRELIRGEGNGVYRGPQSPDLLFKLTEFYDRVEAPISMQARADGYKALTEPREEMIGYVDGVYVRYVNAPLLHYLGSEEVLGRYPWGTDGAPPKRELVRWHKYVWHNVRRDALGQKREGFGVVNHPPEMLNRLLDIAYQKGDDDYRGLINLADYVLLNRRKPEILIRQKYLIITLLEADVYYETRGKPDRDILIKSKLEILSEAGYLRNYEARGDPVALYPKQEMKTLYE